MSSAPPRYAAFVSPHGYGHAARASGVMSAMLRRTGAEFDIFTTVPRWFFEESLGGAFEYHDVVCDVGFVQVSALHADVSATVEALDAFLPFDTAHIGELADAVRLAGCRAVLCDIAPMGVAVAERAGLPSVLLENFTWPWLYEPYFDEAPGLRKHAAELERWRARATVRVQTEPLCAREPGSVLVDPISRVTSRSRAEAREAIGLDAESRVVTLTMGGHGEEMPFLDRLEGLEGYAFLVTGARETRRDGSLYRIEKSTPIFMPDLLRASDAVVAKLGYGIIAEVWREGIPYAYVSRPGFPEMPPLEAFVEKETRGFEIPAADFGSGDWIDRVADLVELERTPRELGGEDAVAELIEAF